MLLGVAPAGDSSAQTATAGTASSAAAGGSAVGTTLAKAAEIPVGGGVEFIANRVVVTQPFKITNGAVVTGPATAPLPRRTIAVTDGDVRLLD